MHETNACWINSAITIAPFPVLSGLLATRTVSILAGLSRVLHCLQKGGRAGERLATKFPEWCPSSNHTTVWWGACCCHLQCQNKTQDLGYNGCYGQYHCHFSTRQLALLVLHCCYIQTRHPGCPYHKNKPKSFMNPVFFEYSLTTSSLMWVCLMKPPSLAWVSTYKGDRGIRTLSSNSNFRAGKAGLFRAECPSYGEHSNCNGQSCRQCT